MNNSKNASGPQVVIDVKRRIQLTAQLACSIAAACAFSRDPAWFWRLAEAEIDHLVADA